MVSKPCVPPRREDRRTSLDRPRVEVVETNTRRDAEHPRSMPPPRSGQVGALVETSSVVLPAPKRSLPVSPETPGRRQRPLSPYAASKKAAKVLAHTYHHLYSPSSVAALQYFSVSVRFQPVEPTSACSSSCSGSTTASHSSSSAEQKPGFTDPDLSWSTSSLAAPLSPAPPSARVQGRRPRLRTAPWSSTICSATLEGLVGAAARPSTDRNRILQTAVKHRPTSNAARALLDRKWRQLARRRGPVTRLVRRRMPVAERGRDGAVTLRSTYKSVIARSRCRGRDSGRRALDVVLSAVGIVALLPVLVALAVAGRVSSQDPVLLRQRRVGVRGSAFSCW